MPTIRAALLLAAAGALAQSAPAQTIWRCGDSYGTQPCAEGRPVADAPPPSRDERSRAAAAVARDARLADSLEKERLRQEAQAARAPLGFTPTAQPDAALEPYKTPEKKATRKLDVFTASVPGSRLPKGKSGRDKGSKEEKKAPSAVGPAARP